MPSEKTLVAIDGSEWSDRALRPRPAARVDRRRRGRARALPGDDRPL